MVIPHGFMTKATGGGSYTNRQRENVLQHRAWSYARPSNASAITIYGIRMVIAGLYHPVYAGRTGTKNSFERDPTGGSTDWSGESITIAQARLGALIMRGA